MSEIQRALPTSRRDLAEVRPYELGAIRIDRMPPPPEPPIDPTPRVNALLQEAEAVLARAKAQEADVKREREQVLAEARVQGLAEGKAQAAAETALLQQELQHWLEELPSAFERFCAAQAPPLAQLCMTAVEKILQEQLTLEPERVVAIVRSAIAHVPHSQRLVVQVHPEDIALLQGSTLREGSLAPEIILEADPQLQRGGCRVEGRQGVVDASLEGALLRLSGILVEE